MVSYGWHDDGGGAWETSGDISATGTLLLNGFICARLIPFKHDDDGGSALVGGI